MEAREIGLLIRSITANINDYIEKHVSQYGLKRGQFEYFLIISMRPGINQLELANMRKVGKASVTKSIKILENDGFIYRLADEKDKRNSLCYVTQKGETIVDEMMKIQTQIEDQVLSGFSHEDKNHFYKSLEQLYINTCSLKETP